MIPLFPEGFQLLSSESSNPLPVPNPPHYFDPQPLNPSQLRRRIRQHPHHHHFDTPDQGIAKP